MTIRSERLLGAIEAEIANVSRLEHELARTRLVLRDHATRLRLGEDPDQILTALRFGVPHATSLSVLERVDPILSDGGMAESSSGDRL